MTLRIGFVDTGFISEFHFNGFATEPRCKVTGVTRTWREDTNRAAQQAKLDAFAAKHGLKAYGSFEEMAASPDIDAVLIASINPCHYSQVMTALNCGKHVLVEKPVVKTAAELEAIRDLAAQKGLIVVPAHNFAYRGAVLEAKRRVLAGELGNIQYASFTKSFYSTSVNGNWRSRHELAWGGALIDSGTHLVYQTIQLLGKPSCVQALAARNVLKMDDEDIAAVQLLYPNGTIAHVMQNWGSGHGQDIEGIRLVGTEGRIAISDALYVNGEKINPDVAYADSFKNQAKSFVATILDEKQPESTLDDALLTMRIIDAAYESIKTGRTISL